MWVGAMIDKEKYNALYEDWIERGAELQAIADLCYEQYTLFCDTDMPEVYGTFLGIHERIEVFLEKDNEDM